MTCPVPMVMQRVKMTAGCACAESEVRIGMLTIVPMEPSNIIPYSTEITPTFIACYNTATGGMGLISKTVEITPTHEETKSFLSASEACQLLKYINIQQ